MRSVGPNGEARPSSPPFAAEQAAHDLTDFFLALFLHVRVVLSFCRVERVLFGNTLKSATLLREIPNAGRKPLRENDNFLYPQKKVMSLSQHLR